VQENNLINQPISNLLLDTSFFLWEKEVPQSEDRIIYIEGGNDSLLEIAKVVDWGKDEISGSIGTSWFSINQGRRSDSPCRPDSLLTWHYHPSGPLAFSFQDWLTFLLSGALASCLFTHEGICLLLKLENQERTALIEMLRSKWAQKQGKPNLFYLESRRLFENFLGLRLSTDISNTRFAEQLGVHCEYWIYYE